jgi:pimeloyl-ACP methyl ester carboxylesterase
MNEQAARQKIDTAKSPVILVPGIIFPAVLSYAPLLEALKGHANAMTKELEVYSEVVPPVGYGVETEVEGIRRIAEQAGMDSFHLVGYSAGGLAALGFVEKYPEQVRSLTLIEQYGTGNSRNSREEAAFLLEAEQVISLPPAERVQAFLPLNLGRDAQTPPPPDMSPAWMALRPAGITALIRSAQAAAISRERLREFQRPVYVAYGSLSHAIWKIMAAQLEGIFSNIRVEVYEGIHHLSPPQRSQPEKFAHTLLALWAQAEHGYK